jgi:hypothetical protein
MVSKKLKDAVRTSEKKLYVIAHEAKMHPSMLSNIINEALNIKDGDERVISIGRVVGVSPKDCFE